MALTLSGNSGNTTLDSSNGITFSDSSNQQYAASPYGLKNRIINGDMRIDQRNAGASVTQTTSTVYTLDRWVSYGTVTSKFTTQQNAGSVTPPAGFTNYLGITSSSAYTVGSTDVFVIGQKIEGYNISDLAFGTANAKTITISFWVRSSLTGTFGATLSNNAFDRGYPFTYTISSANTWEQKTVTITGDTTGTWTTTNTTGLTLWFGLGCGSSVSGTAGSWQAAGYYSATGATSVVGTNGATFYITGVQLEIGSTATPFERRMYGQELINCQRYYWRLTSSGSDTWIPAWTTTTTQARAMFQFPVIMRASPTAVETSGTATDYGVTSTTSTVNCNAVPAFGGASSTFMALLNFGVASGLTAGQGCAGRIQTSTAYIGFSAEL